MCINPNYIVDNDNHKIAVQIDIATYNKITETLEDFALFKLMEDNKDDDTLSLNDAREYYKALKEDNAS